jgi:hypothetical protein
MARIDHERHAAPLQLPRELDAGTVLEQEIDDGGVRRIGGKPRQGGGARGERLDGAADVFEISLDRHADERLILDDEAADWSRNGCHGPHHQ